MSSERVLVVDVGTSSVRVGVFDDTGAALHNVERELLPDTPSDGIVQFDARAMADTCLDLAAAALERTGPVDAVGISNQRGSTVVWDRSTGAPVGPGIGWQDLRTIGACLTLRAQGVRTGPNQSATKLQWLLEQLEDHGWARDLCFGTVDTWVAWTLSQGAVHVTDATNAAITGLQVARNPAVWDTEILKVLGIPLEMLPSIVDSSGVVGEATALPGAPPIAALLGDQQASLVGQGCVHPGDAKITFGTGGMLDLVLGEEPPAFDQRGPAGTFPIVAWRHEGRITWGIEAVMLAAGTNIQWLRDDLGLISTSDESHELASSCDDTGGVVYVPALLGLGTPAWDYGARGAFFGLTRGTGRAEIVRAVLEGVAKRGADLVDAAEADSGIAIPALRVDGGMTDNETFVQALADAAQRPVEISPMREATSRGAALMAGLAVGHHSSVDDLAQTWKPRVRVEPARVLDRDRWREAIARARNWIPELSGIDF
ncbi:MAG: FGGY-family carbohydrate kinase [Actinomycetota bacterium]|nr:FGGY-family carbohydrate kinase [Actinomycetota bacterium]